MWDSTDSVNLRTFLSSLTGLRFLQNLESKEPDLSGDTLEAAALSSKETKGYRDCRNQITILAEFKPEEETPPTYVNTDSL